MPHSLAYSPVFWRHFLSSSSFFQNDSSLCKLYKSKPVQYSCMESKKNKNKMGKACVISILFPTCQSTVTSSCRIPTMTSELRAIFFHLETSIVQNYFILYPLFQTSRYCLLQVLSRLLGKSSSMCFIPP